MRFTLVGGARDEHLLQASVQTSSKRALNRLPRREDVASVLGLVQEAKLEFGKHRPLSPSSQRFRSPG